MLLVFASHSFIQRASYWLSHTFINWVFLYILGVLVLSGHDFFTYKWYLFFRPMGKTTWLATCFQKTLQEFSEITILKAEQDQIIQCFFQKHLSNHATQALRRTRSLLGLNLKIINDAGFSGDKE